MAGEYQFNDSEKSVVITEPRLPQPWINYLSNGTLHAFVSQAAGGFLWYKSPILFRLTRYRQFHLPLDSPGFYLYVREEDGTIWSPGFRPAETPLDSFQAIHHPGRTRFIAEKNGVRFEVSYFIAPDDNVLIWDCSLTNVGSTARTLDVTAYTEFSQMQWESELKFGYYIKHMLRTEYDENDHALSYTFHNFHPRHADIPLVFFAGTLPVRGYSGDRDDFIGAYRTERDPKGVVTNEPGGGLVQSGEPCGALTHTIEIPANQTIRFSFFTATAEGGSVSPQTAAEERTEMLARFRTTGYVDEQREKLTEWWSAHFSAYEATIPDATSMRQINIWSPVNSVHTGRYSRSVNTAAPGIRGVGFRDTCQDMLAIAYRDPAWAARLFGFLLTEQYEDGHAVHTAYPEEGLPPKTSVHSDDHLWLPLLAYAILAETGDAAFLQEEHPFVTDDGHTEHTASAWEHLVRAVDFTEAHLGAHGLPLTLASDWNDIIGRFAKQGRGETVFAAQQYVVALNQLIEIAGYVNDSKRVAYFEDCRTRMNTALETHAWDGTYWRRGFDDDGNPVGSTQAQYGKLYLNPQSWAVLAGAGTDEQLRSGMQSVADELDTGIGLQVLTPSYASWGSDNPDSLVGYGAGTGENGAIFCHANTWAIMAEAMLGNAERAWRYFTQLIPHNVIEKMGVDRYEAEPYSWVSNIVGPESPRFGWGNVTQITGTAAWMDVAATQYLLGIRPTLAGLLIDPCIPSEWDGFSVRRTYRGRTLRIRVDNSAHVSKGVASITIDGNAVASHGAPVIVADELPASDAVEIVVVMG